MTTALNKVAQLARRRPPAMTPRIEFDPGAPAVVLSPHADDAVLSCWSVLDASPRPVRVVTVCTALPPAGTEGRWDRITGARDSRERMRERLDEDKAALRAIGREWRGLGFLDSQYRGPGEPLDASAVLHALAAARPTLGGLYAPLGIGGHPDHIAARDVAVELARRGFPVSLYADLPYAIEFGWPRWVDGNGNGQPPCNLDAAAYWEQCLEALPWPAERLRARVIPLSGECGERKLAALRMYDTQFDGLDVAPHDRLSNPLWRRYEVRWELEQ